MNTNNYFSKHVVPLAMLLLMLLAGTNATAQNVTVRTSNGSTIAAVKGEGVEDAFFSMGGFALWKHNQLNLTMTTADSDGATMSSSGQFTNPANNIFKSTGEALQLGRGRNTDCYLAFSLPKGYRFTGYEIVFRRNINLGNGSKGNASFGETTSSWDWYSNDTHKTGMKFSTSAARQTIKRESDEMENVLYFKLTNDQNSAYWDSHNNYIEGDDTRAFITLESIELRFTAEADFTPVIPGGSFLNRTAVDIPFSTSCVDLGPIEERFYNENTRVSYSYNNVKDLMANLTLYEEGSHTTDNNFDGTHGEVVAYNDNGTISSQGDFFKVGKAAAEGETAKEQIYYIETPTYLELNNNARTKNPIGYRIVGAEIKYKYGTKQPAHQETVTKEKRTEKQYDTFSISGTVDLWSFDYWDWTHIGNTTYYLTSTAGMSTDEKKKAIWFMDEDGYIRLANNPEMYLKNKTIDRTDNRLAVVSKTDSPAKYAINSSGQITIKSNSNLYLCLQTESEEHWWNTHITKVNYFQMINKGSTKATRAMTGNKVTVNIFETESEIIDFPAFNPSEFTVKLYDKTGKTVYDSKKVTSETKDGSLKITGLNNDAVKIGVTGVGLIQGVLTIQALDPYIDQLEVVCQDKQENAIRMTLPFEANDFSVNGGEFYFYLPQGCIDHKVAITYENLWSHYADETYEGGSAEHNSRFSFVNSDHYNQFTGDNIYNNRTEAAADKETVKERQIVATIGTAPFRFNNADEVGESGGTLTEYPFTKAKYEASPNNGSFSNMEFSVSSSDQHSTAYVFTTDETRYNIAPTTATQHRSYAFYKMIVHVQSAAYTPKVEIVKVYDATNYDDGTNIHANKPFYGAVVTAPYGTSPNIKPGFASDKQIEDAIDKVITNKKDDFSHTDIPESAKQILYLDLTGLGGYFTDAQASMTLNNYKNTKLGTNALVFFPKGVTTKDNNFAFVTEGGSLRAANDIVLTDKQPFFSPYDIQVSSTNYASYSRMVTVPKNGQVQNATVLLPFTVSVKNGVHTNEDGKCSFTMNTMRSNQNMQLNGESDIDYGVAYFAPVTGEKTEANKPYMVKVSSWDESTEDAGQFSFIVKEKASSIVATPKNGSLGQTLFGGESVKGTFEKVNYTFTNQGTYSGKTFPRTDKIFYFANNKYLNLESLIKPTLYVYPFRSVYQYSTSVTPTKLLMSFSVSYDEPQDNTTGISERHAPADLLIQAGNGTLTITATREQNVDIRSMSGMRVNLINMNVGETKTVHLPAGVYIVNNAKIIVK